MALTTEQEAVLLEKINTEREKIALDIISGNLAVDVAINFLYYLNQLLGLISNGSGGGSGGTGVTYSQLTPTITVTTSSPSGTIAAGAKTVSFKVLAPNGVILGATLPEDMDIVEFPYSPGGWGAISYNGSFLILQGR